VVSHKTSSVFGIQHIKGLFDGLVAPPWTVFMSEAFRLAMVFFLRISFLLKSLVFMFPPYIRLPGNFMPKGDLFFGFLAKHFFTYRSILFACTITENFTPKGNKFQAIFFCSNVFPSKKRGSMNFAVFFQITAN
jgi:hypothetical protein